MALSGLDLDRLPQMYGGRLPNDQAPTAPAARGSGERQRIRTSSSRKRPRKGGSDDGDDTDGAAANPAVGALGGIPGLGGTDAASQAVAAAMAAAVAAAAAAAGGNIGLTTQQLMAAAAQAQLSLAASGLNLANIAGNPLGAAPGGTPGGGAPLGGFQALLSGATDSNNTASGLAAALGGAVSAPLSSLAAALGGGAPAGLTPPPLTLPPGTALPPAPIPPAPSAAPAAPLMGVPPPPSGLAAQTEYARNRPRRELAGQRATMGETSESLQLVKPQEFTGQPGSGSPLAQPYTVDMSSWALLAMDFHAHLSNFEVGMGGGRVGGRRVGRGGRGGGAWERGGAGSRGLGGGCGEGGCWAWGEGWQDFG